MRRGRIHPPRNGQARNSRVPSQVSVLVPASEYRFRALGVYQRELLCTVYFCFEKRGPGGIDGLVAPLARREVLLLRSGEGIMHRCCIGTEER